MSVRKAFWVGVTVDYYTEYQNSRNTKTPLIQEIRLSNLYRNHLQRAEGMVQLKSRNLTCKRPCSILAPQSATSRAFTNYKQTSESSPRSEDVGEGNWPCSHLSPKSNIKCQGSWWRSKMDLCEESTTLPSNWEGELAEWCQGKW